MLRKRRQLGQATEKKSWETIFWGEKDNLWCSAPSFLTGTRKQVLLTLPPSWEGEKSCNPAASRTGFRGCCISAASTSAPGGWSYTTPCKWGNNRRIALLDNVTVCISADHWCATTSATHTHRRSRPQEDVRTCTKSSSTFESEYHAGLYTS